MLNHLITKPTSPDFQLKILNEEDKEEISEDSMRPQFRRNLVQRFIRYLAVSDNVHQKEEVTERIKIYFTLLNSLDAVYIQNYVCSVPEFWHLFAKMRDLPSVKTLI